MGFFGKLFGDNGLKGVSSMPASLPPPSSAPAPANNEPAPHLTPPRLYDLGYRGYSVRGVECILPPICPVPAGIFTMGSDPRRDPMAFDRNMPQGWPFDREMPQHLVEVDGFAIGQHPVTVAEYACAVRANAVPEPPTDEIYHPEGDWAKQQAYPDRPVVNVSFYDALAFVTWLRNVTDQPWRLPTEAEWEKAARGTDGRIYPWGNTFDAARCNCSDSSIGTTSPVGSYPTGGSPYHAHDMAGNVWEWVSSALLPYPYRQNDGRETLDAPSVDRVQRGGSWQVFYPSKSLRVTNRFAATTG